MGIFFLFKRCAFTFACCNYLTSQLISHAATVSVTAVADKPLHAKRNLPVRTNFGRYLESSTTNTTATYFNGRSNIHQCPFPYIISVFIRLLGYFIQGIIKYIKSPAFFPFPHEVVDKTCNQFVIELRIWCQG